MSIEQMCHLARLSRAGFYRFRTTPEVGDRDLDLRDAIQRIALEFPCYGRPRMTKELHRRGWQVGHNRVARIMREDNLLCLRRRKFVITTDSKHGRPVYPGNTPECAKRWLRSTRSSTSTSSCRATTTFTRAAAKSQAERQSPPGAPGVIYAISVSGPKMYDLDNRHMPLMARTYTNKQLFQAIEVRPDRLKYTAYSIDGEVADVFELAKPGTASTYVDGSATASSPASVAGNPGR
jgi:transposase InsO family protein